MKLNLLRLVQAFSRRKTKTFSGSPSYFRIGWEWVKTALTQGWKLIQKVRLWGNHDPDPAMASRKQHEKRIYRLEFKVQTHQYAVG